MARRYPATVIVLILTAATLAGSPSAGATLSTTADPTWMVNGVVYSIVKSGNTVYIGGIFTEVSACSPSVGCPNETVNVSDVAALDATTGEAIPDFHPMVAGTPPRVYALAVLGTKLFIGGQFTSVDGTPRLNFAAVDLQTGALDAGADSAVGRDRDQIRGMVATSSRVYVAGSFKNVDGIARPHLAAFDVDGNLDPTWAPSTDGQTHAINLNCDATSVIAGGGFRNAGGSGQPLEPRFGLAMFDATTGALDRWTPDASKLPGDAPPYDLTTTCTKLFVGTGGSNRIMALDLSDNTGDLLWRLTMFGNAQAIARRGNLLLVGGHFTWVPLKGTDQHYDRRHFAVLNLHGRLQSDWIPAFYGDIQTGVWDILVDGPQIWVGGGFTTVSGEERWCIARFTDLPSPPST